MNNFPSYWKIVPLENSVEILDHRRVPVNADERAKRQGNIPYYGATGQAGWIDDFLFDEELVLLGEDGAPFFEKEKNVAFMVNGKSWVNNHAHVLKARSGITLNGFILHYLNHFDYKDYVGGTTRLKLTQGSLKSIPFPLPPLPEQKRIVAKLDKLFAHLDQLKARLEKIPGLLKQFRQAVLTQAVTGRLTEEWRRETKLEGWSEIQLDNGANVVDPHPSHRTPPLVVDGIPYIGIGDIDESGTIDFVNSRKVDPAILGEHRNRYKLKLGDFIFGKIGTIGRPIVIPDKQNYALSANVILIQPNHQVFNSKFLFYYLASPVLERLVNDDTKSTSQPAYGIKKMRNQIVPLPWLEEQKEIVRRVESLFAVADRIEANYKTLKEKIDQLPQAILSKAFRGELVKGDEEAIFNEAQLLAAEAESVYEK